MSHQPLEGDPKNIWQNQKRESTNMSIEELRDKARKFLSKRKRDRAVELGFRLVAASFCGVVLLTARQPAARVIAGLVMAMMFADLGRMLVISYRKYGSFWPTMTLDRDAALTTCLNYYRTELVRSRELARHPAWQLAIAFLMVGVLLRDAFLRTSPELLAVALPFVLIAAAALIVLLGIRKFEARRLDAELDALDKFEQEQEE
jgi:hypothetical protein